MCFLIMKNIANEHAKLFLLFPILIWVWPEADLETRFGLVHFEGNSKKKWVVGSKTEGNQKSLGCEANYHGDNSN